MDIYSKSTSPFGYKLNTDKIDTYGVNHQHFTPRDTLLYQQARLNREEEYKKYFDSQGMQNNYPQLGTRFWDTSSTNNYGFGDSHIEDRVNFLDNISYLNNIQKRSDDMKQSDLPESSIVTDKRSTEIPNLKQISREQLRDQAIKRVLPKLMQDEGDIDFPYLDTMCNITIGRGKLIDSWRLFNRVNFINRAGKPATQEEKRTCFNTFENLASECDKNPIIDGKKHNKLAKSYEQDCDLRISPEEIERLYSEHVRADLKSMEKAMPKFYQLPPEIQNELINHIYNTGYGNFSKKGFVEIVNNPDLSIEQKRVLIAERLTRPYVSQERITRSQNRIMNKE